MTPLFDQRRYLIPFRSNLLPQIFTDTLVIGSGVAGLRAAVAAAEHGEVIVLGKDDPTTGSNTAWAQGGIAVVLERTDSFDEHTADTLSAGAGLCDEPAVRAIVEAGPARIGELLSWGMRLDQDAAGGVTLGREGGHNRHRIVHTDGDATGRELMRCLWAKAKGTPGVRVFTNCFSLDLITGPGGGGQSAEGAPVLGAITHHPKYGLQMIWAKATILASGGAGMVYRETTNPKSASGDGLAMAFRAGATVADMAFVQFHPTTLYLAGASRALITEAIRGEGAYLVDAHGERFMVGQHPMAELAPRDVVSRAIVRQIALRAGTNVFLDVRHLKGFAGKFPGIAQLLAKFDLDPMADLIPIHPAAHYMVGGVLTDLCGRTDLPNLYAAGEVACVGLHGANRLASNSLLEGLVMGEVAGRTAKEATTGGRAARVPVPINSDIRPSELGELDLSDVASSLRSAMWRHSGIERSGPRLADVLDMLDFWARYTLDKIFDTPEGWQTQNMLLVASLIARSAAWRTESRGCHWRSDHPRAAEGLRVHDCWRRGRAEPLLRPVAGGAGAAGAEGLGAAGGAAVAEAARA